MSPDLHTVVEWVLDEGHLNTELLARLRAAWEAEQGPRTEGLQIGNFTLSRYDEGSYWLAHKDGEGMQVRQERLQALVDELWKEF